ncbi:MAG: thiamine pyrophosphate-binding protein [Solirubrobacteraceae bacterium]
MKRLGRDIVFDYLRDLGVEYIFGVPGTNEIPLIDATSEPDSGVAYIPCLHENIAMGAAMGYAWASGKPGIVELHVTPGAGHGVGNLYNAYKSHVPLVVICAQQHSDLLVQEPVLASDLVRTAGQYTKWAYEVRCAEELPLVLQRAFKEALTPPMRPVFLSIPWNFTLAEVEQGPPHVTRVGRHFIGDAQAVAHAAELLAAARTPILIAGDGVGAADAWAELERLAELLGAPVYNEPMSSYMNYPNHLYHWQGELPQNPQGIQETFKGHDVALLCGYNAQAHVFVYRYSQGPLIPLEVTQLYLHDDAWEIGKNAYGEAAILGDIKATLPVLCERIAGDARRDAAAAGARAVELRRRHERRLDALDEHAQTRSARPGDELPRGEDVAIALGRLQDEMPAPLTLVDEAISDQEAFHQYVRFDTPSSYLNAQGGSLGMSMPASIGLKLAAAGARTIVNTVGDGTSLFYPHSWWTIRKFDVAVLYIVTNNREYKTLQLGRELIEGTYHWKPAGDAWYLRLREPPVSFVGLAASFGVAGSLVARLDELEDRLREGLAAVAAGNPFVVEVLTDSSLDPGGLAVRTSAPAAGAGASEEHARFRRLGPP